MNVMNNYTKAADSRVWYTQKSSFGLERFHGDHWRGLEMLRYYSQFRL